MAQIQDPNSSHRFVVAIGSELVAAFTECSLPNLEFETEERKEGGQNNYTHTLTGRRKAGRLTLKRGLTKSPMLLKWYNDLLKGEVTTATKDVSLIMYDSMSNVVAWWYFEKAVPVKWTGPQFKSDQAALAIETLELVVHDYVYVES